nr:MAG TPA: hypothetical protein [Caudoviricetes sp.]
MIAYYNSIKVKYGSHILIIGYLLEALLIIF